MLLSVVIILYICSVAADWLLHRRLRRFRRTFIVWVVATDALPLLTAAALFILPDNPPLYVRITMWMLWTWMAFAMPRLVFCVCYLLHAPRFGLLAASALFILFVWGATAGRTTLRVARTEFCSPRLPASFDGVRIVQISDLHLGSLVSTRREIERMVDSINTLRPDFIVFTGDLVNIRYTELDTLSMRLLRGLHAPVYSVTGNHDIGSYIRDTAALPMQENLARLITRQREMGWTLLDDTTVYLRRNGDSIALSGISFDPALRLLRHDAVLPQADFSAVYRNIPHSTFDITAVHLPQLWEQVTAAYPVDITLTGHVHAMQFKLRLLGCEFSPARLLYTRWSGRYDDAEGRMLYINDGIGYVGYPMRLGAYPEITLITLRRCE